MPVKKNIEDFNMRWLHHVAADGNLSELEYLLKTLKVPADSRDQSTETHRQTASMRACAKGMPKALEMLLIAGADRKILTRSNMTLDDIVNKHLRENDFTTTKEDYEGCLNVLKRFDSLMSKVRSTT